MDKLGGRKKAYAVLVLCATTAIASRAQTFRTLVRFNGTDGANPSAPLIQASDGNLYGTTSGDWVNTYGTVFEMTPGGTLTVLHSFDSTDGANPSGQLAQATDGDLYGTTASGGDSNNGTVFKITTAGELTTLCSFEGTNGALPQAGLVQASNGNFYGTTSAGGENNFGTVFEITAAGELTTLHIFDGKDGAYPEAGLVQATNGNFYGTTSGGGRNGLGTVFKMTPKGALTVLHSFDLTEGFTPYSKLVQATDGDFYGTTVSGPGTDSYGTVFEFTLAGTLTTLYSFGYSDGAYPYDGLIQASDGNFYGTTQAGGPPYFGGTIFKITPTGTLTTLYNFCPQRGCADGFNPSPGLVQATNGDFYGVTLFGGLSVPPCSFDCGTVFSLSPPQSVTATSLASSLNPSLYGQSVTFTAAVTTTGSIAATGTVVFSWSDNTIGTAMLNSSGVATLTKSNLNADTFPMVATYKGDANNHGSTSAIVEQMVEQTTSTATLTSSANPSAVGETVKFTAKITSPTVVVRGPVTFTAGNTTLGTVELDAGVATLSTSSLSAGSATVTVTYSGDSDIKGSSASVTQVVQ